MDKMDGYQYFKNLNKILNDGKSYSKNSKQSNIANEEDSKDTNKDIEEPDSHCFGKAENKINVIENNEKEFDDKNNEGDVANFDKSNEIINENRIINTQKSPIDFVPFNTDISPILYNTLSNNEGFNMSNSNSKNLINKKGKFYINN